VYRLPEDLDAEVASIALEHLGGSLETLTPEQARYLESWQEGT
jgi:adenosylhomocysteinase